MAPPPTWLTLAALLAGAPCSADVAAPFARPGWVGSCEAAVRRARDRAARIDPAFADSTVEVLREGGAWLVRFDLLGEAWPAPSRDQEGYNLDLEEWRLGPPLPPGQA